MARDLIPPPSPAGRPTSPGGTPNLIELPPEPPRSGAEPAQVADLAPSRYRNRFGFLIGALAGVVVAVAAAVAIALVSGDTAAQEGFGAHWSSRQPAPTPPRGRASPPTGRPGTRRRRTRPRARRRSPPTWAPSTSSPTAAS